MDWRHIPSLFALRAFEAVARHESLTKAAGELNVTHAAVSQHIKTLERDFAAKLLERRGRRMELTDAGRLLAHALSDGFGRIQEGVRAVRDLQETRPLSITTTPSFAENWLMPRMGSFWAAHPEIRVSINPGVGLMDLARDGHDLAIRYGKGDWPGYHVEKLVSARFYAVATPDFAARHALDDSSDLTGIPWFFEVLSGEHRRWAESQGLIGSDTEVSTFETLSLVMSAVRSGYGMTVSAQALVERDLEAGNLVALAQGGVDRLGYFILTPPTGASANAQKFIRWLKSKA